MRTVRRLVQVLPLLLVAVFIVAEVSGARPLRAQPTAVATVDLARVLDGLDQRADAEVGLKTMADGIRAEREQRESDIKAIQDRADAATDETVRMQHEEDAVKASLDYQAWIRFVQNKLDVERALLLQDLYRSITDAIADMAETEGWHLVIVDDSNSDLSWSEDSQLSREGQTLQKIRGRRVLYGSPIVDLTDQLVIRMNNAHRAGTN